MIKLLKKNFSKRTRDKLPAVDSKYYTEKYFLYWGNYQDFLKSEGTTLEHFPIYKRIVQLAHIKPKMKVLDLGCGRGELVIYTARMGADVEGIDYAGAAIKMAKKSAATQSKEVQSRIKIRKIDVKKLNPPENYYDRIFLVDLIEHLRPWEVDFLLPKIKRALKKSGSIVIHTYPNRLAFYGFCLYRIYYYIAYGKPNKDKFRDDCYDPIVHINEQTTFSLKKILKKHGFEYRVWLERGWFFTILELGSKKSWMKKITVKIIKNWPFRPFFFSNILAVAWRKNAK